MSGLLLLGAAWILLMLAAYLGLGRLLNGWQGRSSALGRYCTPMIKYGWLVVVGVALVARLAPDLILPVGATYDIESYQIVAKLALTGQDVYTDPVAEDRYPYLPFQMYWMAFAHKVARHLHWPFVKVVRLAPILADTGIALALYLALKRSVSLKAGLAAGLGYALNPIPIFVSAYHGQFDALPALLLLLAVLTVERSAITTGGLLGLGILDKSWPVLFLPSLLRKVTSWRQKALVLGLAVLVPLLGVGFYSTLFKADPILVILAALGYNHGIGIWGYTYFFRMLTIINPYFQSWFAWIMEYGRFITLAVLAIVWLTRARKQAIEAEILTILVTFFAVTHAFSIQYLMWLVPLALLNRESRWLTLYTLGAFIYMFLTYNILILDQNIAQALPWPEADWFLIMPSGLPVWAITVVWAVARWFKPAQLAAPQIPLA